MEDRRIARGRDKVAGLAGCVKEKAMVGVEDEKTRAGDKYIKDEGPPGPPDVQGRTHCWWHTCNSSDPNRVHRPGHVHLGHERVCRQVP